jgi:hypothetical protein
VKPVTCGQCAEFTPSQSHDAHAIGVCNAVERYKASLGRKIRASEYDDVQDAIGNFNSPGGRGRWRLCRPFIERKCTKFVPKLAVVK